MMSKFKTVWGLYFINITRTEGYSDFFETYEQALNAMDVRDHEGWTRIEEQTYEIEEDSHHDCGDDE